MHLDYDPGSEAAYVQFLDEPVDATRQVDDDRILDFTADGRVLGLELLGVRGGVRLSGLPVDQGAVARLLHGAGIPVLDALEVTGALLLSPAVTTGSATFEQHAGALAVPLLMPNHPPDPFGHEMGPLSVTGPRLSVEVPCVHSS